MNLPKVLACVIFILLGGAILYKGIRLTRSIGIGNSFIDLITGAAFVFIGALIALGYIN